MNVSQQIKLLEPQITKLDELEKIQDHESYDAWHMQTELLLKKILSDDASEVQEFHRLDGKSRVVIGSRNPSAQAINAQRKTEAYFRDVKKSRSLLTGVFDFLKSTESGDENTTRLVQAPLSRYTIRFRKSAQGYILAATTQKLSRRVLRLFVTDSVTSLHTKQALKHSAREVFTSKVLMPRTLIQISKMQLNT